MNITLRQATLADAARMRELAFASGLRNRETTPLQPPDDLWRWVQDGFTFAVVAECQGQLIGMATMCHTVTFLGKRARLEDVAVHPEWEGHGTAAKLLMHCFFHARMAWGVERIIWACEDLPHRQRARDFYQSRIDAVMRDGTTSAFQLPLNWTPPNGLSDYYGPLP